MFHGGSGSTKEEIKTAVTSGVVKMNVDTGNAAMLSELMALTNLFIRYSMGIPLRYPGLHSQEERLSLGSGR